MNLRICDDGAARLAPASIELLERTFAPEAPVAGGTEITLADGGRWLAAIAVGRTGQAGEFLLAADLGNNGRLVDLVGRDEALQQFRSFLMGQAL
jgi:hypothetical protein